MKPHTTAARLRRWTVATGVFALCAAASAQAPLWITQFGTDGYDVTTSLAPDSAGGVFAAGGVDGRGGPGAPEVDIWLARYDAAGSRTWYTQFGPSEDDKGAFASALAPDSAGGVFAAGGTSGSLTGPITGVADVWLARYDAAGNQIWITQFGTGAGDHAAALAADSAGGAFVAGQTWGSLGGPSAGGSDAWLARYDASGNQIWATQFGTAASDTAAGLAPDGAGGVFVVGTTYGSLGGPSTGSRDMWLARYNAAGQQAWIRQFGTEASDWAGALAPDGAGGVFMAGSTWGDLGGGGSIGFGDAWLARYDHAGNRTWARQFGTPGIDGVEAVAPDSAGGVFVGGATSGSLGGPIAGGWDAWLAHYDAFGNRSGVFQFGTSVHDVPRALAPGLGGGVFIGGVTLGSLGGPSAGDGDAWLGYYPDAPCYADCDGSGELDISDFWCFQNLFGAGDFGADCDGSGKLDFFDFLCYQDAFARGCP